MAGRMRNALRVLLGRAQSMGLSVKASAVGPIVAFGRTGRPLWTPREYAQLSDEAYQKNVIAYRCINMIAKGAASVPLDLFSGKGDDRQQIDDHPLLDLLHRPSPQQDGFAFREENIAYLQIAGQFYIEGAGPTGKPPIELYSLRPDRMKVVPGSLGVPEAYEYRVGSRKVRFEVDRLSGKSAILHVKLFHPLNDWYGMSPIEAAAFSIDQHNQAGAWNKALLDNSGRPSGALVYEPKDGAPATLPEQSRYDLEEALEDQYSGSSAQRLGLPLILEGNLKWQEMSMSPRDMDWLKGRDVSARDVALAFDVPPQLVGIPDQQTYSNNREARLAMWEDKIIPTVGREVSAYNNWLVPAFGDNLELVPDYTDVPALGPRRERQWERIQNSDWLTINEKREATGYEPIADPAGDQILVSATMVPLGFEPTPLPEGEPNPEGEDDEGEEEPITRGLNGGRDALVAYLKSAGLSEDEAEGVAKAVDQVGVPAS